MRARRVCLHIAFSFLSLFNGFLYSKNKDKKETACFSISPKPAWVKEVSFSTEPITPKPSQVDAQVLLIDVQENVLEPANYFHLVVRPLNKDGLQNYGELSIAFDPSFKKAEIHLLRIFRDGKWQDRLHTSKHLLIKGEQNSERHIYDGSLSLISFLDDLRVGDFVEIAGSTLGKNPLQRHFCDFFQFDRPYSVEKISYRVLAKQDSIQFKSFNLNTEPTITDLPSGLREWVWEATETAPCVNESNEPEWYEPHPCVVISEYASWEELGEELKPIYALPGDVEKKVPEEVISLIQQWKSRSPDLTEQALLATRFVQDEVRFLGFEDGIHKVKPRDPWLVFSNRYGDCKDKVLLLKALLKLLGIQSSPVLVHPTKGKLLPEMLPSYLLFNHVFLQLQIENVVYWVETTLSPQGGALKDSYYPNFQWGLLLNERPSLVKIPEAVIEEPMKFETHIDVSKNGDGEVKFLQKGKGYHANVMRARYRDKGEASMTDALLKQLQDIYENVSVKTPFSVSDDRAANVTTFDATFRIEGLVKKHEMEIFSHIVRNYLEFPNVRRSAPFALTYPLWIKEHIEVATPFIEWDAKTVGGVLDHTSVYCNQLVTKKGSCVAFDFELKHVSDHVPSEEIRNYWKGVNTLSRKANNSLLLTFGEDKKRPSPWAFLFAK